MSMNIREPREGISIDYSIFPIAGDEITLGNPEDIIWASIKNLCSYDVGDRVLKRYHHKTSSAERKIIYKNICLYIQQAQNFYKAALTAEAVSSPLLYYYSFLHLAKALAEIRYPNFHLMPESTRHGISWTPHPQDTINMKNESLKVTARGVWHCFYEAVLGTTLTMPNPLHLKIVDLFSYCPEISIEYERTLRRKANLIELVKIDELIDKDQKEAWIKLSISREDFKSKLLRNDFLTYLNSNSSISFEEVKEKQKSQRTFEYIDPINYDKRSNVEKILQPNIINLNTYTCLANKEIGYSFPVIYGYRLNFPQSIVLYSIVF